MRVAPEGQVAHGGQRRQVQLAPEVHHLALPRPQRHLHVRCASLQGMQGLKI